MDSCTAIAHPNIALVKYWGKRDSAKNLPAVPSISITLSSLRTRTIVRFDKHLEHDELSLAGGGGTEASHQDQQRVSRFLDLVRARAALRLFASVTTENNFPTGAGLASSASGFAALAVAASRAAGISLSPTDLSRLARQGSGSAARSIFGGFAQMHCGTADDGSDAFAEPLAGPTHWPLSVLVAVTSEAPKKTGSTEGMERTRATSPFYVGFVEAAGGDVCAARQAVLSRDFERLADVAEHSCLKMHGLMLSARPPLIYWNAATLALIHEVQALRRQGVPVFFTIDAGPQLKAVCLPEAEQQVHDALQGFPGVRRVLVSGLGAGARVVC